MTQIQDARGRRPSLRVIDVDELGRRPNASNAGHPAVASCRDFYHAPATAGHLFVLGDTRDNSTDSRVMSQMSFIPVEDVIGRAGMIFFSIAEGQQGQPGKFRTERNRAIVVL